MCTPKTAKQYRALGVNRALGAVDTLRKLIYEERKAVDIMKDDGGAWFSDMYYIEGVLNELIAFLGGH